jgi:8-oxo-dGTP diphosphatase
MPHVHEQIDFTVEVFCVHRARVLLRRHDKFGIWLGVGGHVELDEDPNAAAHREVREEVGLEIELIGVTSVPVDPRSKDYRQLVPPAFLHRDRVAASHEHVTLTYFARARDDTVITSGRDVSDVWRWVTREELDDPDLDLRANVRFYAEQALMAVRNAGHSGPTIPGIT